MEAEKGGAPDSGSELGLAAESTVASACGEPAQQTELNSAPQAHKSIFHQSRNC